MIAVAPAMLAALAVATLFVALLPFAVYRFLRRPMPLDKRDAIVGIAVFTLFAMLLERGFYGLLLHFQPVLSWLARPGMFAAFGLISAALFEEIGRYAGLSWLVRRFGATDGDGRGLGYGIGHGGAQLWFVGVAVLGQWTYLAWLADHGQLNAQLATMPADLALRIQVMLATLTMPSIATMVLERLAAFVVQLALSVLMWRGVRAGKRWILPLAIVLHPFGDLPTVLYRLGTVPFAWMTGTYVIAIVALAAVLAKCCRAASMRR